jgi:hypothetical protein
MLFVSYCEHGVAWLAAILCYKQGAFWLDSGLGVWTVKFCNISIHTMTLGMVYPVIDMSTRNLPGDKGLPARKNDHLTVSLLSRQHWETDISKLVTASHRDSVGFFTFLR